MKQAIKLLLVEDSENDAILIRNALREAGFDTTSKRVDTAPEMEAALDSEEWDLIISDYSLPTLTGMEALGLYRDRKLEIPFIVVSGEIGEFAAVGIMRAGAHDYVMKQDLARLAPAVRRELKDAKTRRERRAAQHAQRQSEERYRALFEQSKNAIYMTSLNGEFIDINPAALELIGYTREEIFEVNAFDLFLNDHTREEVLRSLEESGSAVEVESVFLRKDGTKGASVQSLITQRNEEGEIIGIQGIARDITRQRDLEAQMRRAQRLESLGTLVSGVTHDFNNILSSVIGFSEMALSDCSADEPVREDLTFILKAGQRAKELVRQILTFSRQIEGERGPIGLHLVVKEALQLLRATLPPTIEVVADVNRDTPQAFADPTQMHQVVMNLCTNAYHAMKERGGVITVSLEPCEVSEESVQYLQDLAAGEYACLTVSDTGEGMDEQTLERVFEPFFTTKDIGEGTGLGMSTTYGIVTSHEGTIDIESKLGEGTTVRVYIPLAGERQDEGPAEPCEITGGSESILVVDDDTACGALAERVLGSLGYRVTVMTNGAEALERVRQEGSRFDLVLTDYLMPKLTGTELARELSALQPGVPIILMTGIGTDSVPTLEDEAGLSAILMKPASKEDFARTVRATLDQQLTTEV